MSMSTGSGESRSGTWNLADGALSSAYIALVEILPLNTLYGVLETGGTI